MKAVRPAPLWYVVLIFTVSIFITVGACVWYVNHALSRQCDMWRAEVAVYQEAPPPTETGRKMAATKEALLQKNC